MKNTGLGCMFCSPDPCQCNTKKRRPANSKKPATKPAAKSVTTGAPVQASDPVPPPAQPTKKPTALKRPEKKRPTPSPGSGTGDVRGGGAEEVRVVAAQSRTVPDVRARSAFSGKVKAQEENLELEAQAITMFANEDMLHHESLEELRDRIRLPGYRIDAMIWRQKKNGH